MRDPCQAACHLQYVWMVGFSALSIELLELQTVNNKYIEVGACMCYPLIVCEEID